MIQKAIYCLLLIATPALQAQTLHVPDPVRFLALGDSYTIGESVDTSERWPVQFASKLTELGYSVDTLEIIAVTGWRTDNLQAGINSANPEGFNLVSLLIGVNNQYQDGSIAVYEEEFEELLLEAIALAGNDTSSVFVLSIPDYAYTPFGAGSSSISFEIDEFNEVNERISQKYKVPYYYITDISRRGLAEPELVAPDGLHPSGKQYEAWVDRIMENVDPPTNIKEIRSPRLMDQVFLLPNQTMLNTYSSTAQLNLYESGSGRLLLQKSIRRGETWKLNPDNLNKGLYIFTLYSGDTYIKSGKILVP